MVCLVSSVRLWLALGLLLGPFGCPRAPFGFLWVPLGSLWHPFGSLCGGLGSLWGGIGLPLACPWLALGALGSFWVPFGFLGSLWELNVHRLQCLCTESNLLEHATEATGAAEVVSETPARSPPPARAGGQDVGSYTNSVKLGYI